MRDAKMRRLSKPPAALQSPRKVARAIFERGPKHKTNGIECTPLRAFSPNVELLDGNAAHVRFMPAALARAMGATGSAEIHNENGRANARGSADAMRGPRARGRTMDATDYE
jgi:hypothetical protein